MEPTVFNIVIATAEDIPDLERIGRSTFYESFIEITPEKDMLAYLDISFNPEVLKEELTDPSSVFYLVKTGGRIAGYGKINFDKPPYGMAEMEGCMEIQRIYIAKEFQGMGAARQLMDVFFEEAKKRKFKTTWLSTGAFNNKALNFYNKYGFRQVAHHSFPVGRVYFDDVILLKDEG
jgi:ribosomal protein S18 acetylase RimI-like enzyme